MTQNNPSEFEVNDANEAQPNRLKGWMYVFAIFSASALILIMLSGGVKFGSQQTQQTLPAPKSSDNPVSIDLGPSESGFNQSQPQGVFQQGTNLSGGVQPQSNGVQESTNVDNPTAENNQNTNQQNCTQNDKQERPSFCVEIPPPIR